jgi:hypothetical protein
VRLLEPIVGSAFGLPLSLAPLPARWRVVFHPPVRVGSQEGRLLVNADRSLEVAREIQGTVQATLDRRASAYPLGRLSSWIASRGLASPPARADDPPRSSAAAGAVHEIEDRGRRAGPRPPPVGRQNSIRHRERRTGDASEGRVQGR